MDSTLYLERAENELELARVIFTISDDKDTAMLLLKEPLTFYSAVISHSYYCIFYGAKAYLLSKGVRTKPPLEHKATYEEFRRFVLQGVIDVELLKVYESSLYKADALLEIFRLEKGKRGNFTYQKLPQANREPAIESLEHASVFFRQIYNILRYHSP